MNKLAATVCAFLLASGLALAQTPPCVTSDPSAVAIDTLRTTITVPPVYASESIDSSSAATDGEISYRSKAKSNGQITLEICIWRVQNGGGVVYSIIPGSISFSGDDATIDAMSTQMLFDLLAQAAIGRGMSAGYSVCAESCTSNVARISLPACVRRLGQGTGTRFESCDPGSCCLRTYAICCSDGLDAPRLTLVGSMSSGCSAGSIGSGCEPVCR